MKYTPRLFRWIFSFLTTVCVIHSTDAKIEYPDFDQSMLRVGLGFSNIDPEFSSKSQARYDARNQDMISRLRELYYHNIKAAAEDQSSLRIPRIVHQIWLGGPVPERFRQWMESWMRLEGWEYKLWTDKEVHGLHLHNRGLYDTSQNFGEKADILRLELLSQFGGVYVDVDFECLNPDTFEELHHSFDFYIGFEPLEHGFTRKFNMFKVCNAIIGAAPNHPLIHDLIENLKANYFAYRTCCTVVQKTGPSYLTRILCEHEFSNTHRKRNMYLPCSFFYPVNEPEIRYFFQHPELPAPIAKETAGFHYWYGTWWKKDPFASSVNHIEKNYYIPGEQ